MPYEYINITDDEDGEVQTQLEGEDTRKCLLCLKYRGGGGGGGQGVGGLGLNQYKPIFAL